MRERMAVRIAAVAATVIVLLAAVLVPPARGDVVTGDASPDATAWNSQRKVARDSSGRLYVAARVSDPDLGFAVRIFRSVDNGATWSTLPRVPEAAGEMSRASLAVDPRDRVHLAWTEPVGPDLQVFHAEWTGAGWNPRTQVSQTPGYSGFPAIAADRQGRLHAAWYGFDGSTYQVYYRARSAEGIWGPTETVSTGLADANNPALAVGPDDRPHVAWFLFTGGRWSVVYTMREEAWSPISRLSNASNRALDPSLAVTSANVVFAAWTEVVPNGTQTIVTSHGNASGWSRSEALAWFSLPGGHPVVALDGGDRAFVFWDQLDASIRFRSYNETWGTTSSLAANGTASFPSVRWAAVANPFFSGVNRLDVVWTEAAADGARVVLAGVPVPAVGQPPEASLDLTGVAVFVAVVLILAGFLWFRHRRIRSRVGRLP